MDVRLKPHRSAAPAVFMRGGTSKGVFFLEDDLPKDAEARDRFLLSVMGSPDPYGRQLNGMGGGISSLSKIIIVRKSGFPETDVDYIHGQVSVDQPVVDYSANCGNLSSAVAQFAVQAGLVTAPAEGEAVVRLHNLNSGLNLSSRFQVEGGLPIYDGEFEMPGVSGGGSRVSLEYVMPDDPLFWSGHPIDALDAGDGKRIEASGPNASLPCVFVRANDVGLKVDMTPDEIDANRTATAILETLRREAAVRMGLATSASDVPQASPKIGIVGKPVDYRALDGSQINAVDYDIAVRMMSMGKAHKAVPLTAAMCLAAASLARNSIPREIFAEEGPRVRVGTPSGVLDVGAIVSERNGVDFAEKTIVYSTANRLMAGEVYGYV